MVTCSIEGCDKGVKGRGWCNKHYKRWRTHGDPHVVARGGQRKGVLVGEKNPYWSGEKVSYSGMHQRVKRARGAASTLICSCGSKADEWAYNHDDPNEIRGLDKGTLKPYSLDLNYYQPMCRSCHRTLDSRSKEAA